MRTIVAVLMMAMVGEAMCATIDLGDFKGGQWNGVVESPGGVELPDGVPAGRGIGLWRNLPQTAGISAAGFPRDLTKYTHLSFWLHSAKSNNQGLLLFFGSENPASAEAGDYFYRHLKVNWTGWRYFRFSLRDDFGLSRRPVGWNKIDNFWIHASGWDNTPLADTELRFCDMKLTYDDIDLSRVGSRRESDTVLVHDIEVRNQGEASRSVEFRVVSKDSGLEVEIPRGVEEVGVERSRQFAVKLRCTDGALPALSRLGCRIGVLAKGEEPSEFFLDLHMHGSLARGRHPYLFVDAEGLSALRGKLNDGWIGEWYSRLLARCDDALSKPVEVSKMEGQWPHHYVCKACGVRLRKVDAGHSCTKCGKVYTGWPYDQVLEGYRHCTNWTMIKSMGQAYALSGEEKYARRAREILLAYVEVYPTFTYHDVRGGSSHSGGRMLSQTLDEAVQVIDVAWGYDLIYNSPCLSEEDKQKIENIFLKEVARTILRHDAGISNWQTWHNAGVAAIGFAINDSELIYHVLKGDSGMEFQLEKSILEDGFWYEGTASYHFYSLDALIWTVQAALMAGLDYTDNPRLIGMFDAPLAYITPGFTFPAINDGDATPMRGFAGSYEWAYGRYGKPEYGWAVSLISRRGDRGVFFGKETLPVDVDISTLLKSRDFSGLGAVVLRQSRPGGQPWYVHFDYGPHGGGHGHYDKLVLNVYAAGRLQAPDPGRLAYAAALQGSWYRHTVAHNTVVVDERSQVPATGRLTSFREEGDVVLAQAECDTMVPGVLFRRSVALVDGILVDVFQAQSDREHCYDYAWHNFGEWSDIEGLDFQPMESLAKGIHGYQHIAEPKIVGTDQDWIVEFKNDKSLGRFWMKGETGTKLIRGTGVANNPPQPCPMVLVRRQGKNACFVSCVEYLVGETPRQASVQLVSAPYDPKVVVEVTLDGKQKRRIEF